MCFVDDQRVVAAQIAIGLGFGEQDAVGHHLNQIIRATFVGEAHFVAYQITRLRLQFVGNASGHRARCNAPRLSATNKAMNAALEIEAYLG